MGVVFSKCAGLRRSEGSPIHAAIFSKYLGLGVFGVAGFAGVLRLLEMARKPINDFAAWWPSTDPNSVCKTFPELIRAPLES